MLVILLQMSYSSSQAKRKNIYLNDLNEIRRILQRIQWIEMLLDRIWYFLTQCAVLFSLREKKVGKLIFGFPNEMKNLLERERPASSH